MQKKIFCQPKVAGNIDQIFFSRSIWLSLKSTEARLVRFGARFRWTRPGVEPGSVIFFQTGLETFGRCLKKDKKPLEQVFVATKMAPDLPFVFLLYLHFLPFLFFFPWQQKAKDLLEILFSDYHHQLLKKKLSKWWGKESSAVVALIEMRLNLTRLHWCAALEQVLQGPNVLSPDGWGQRSQSKSLSTQLFDKVTLSFGKY